MMRGDWARLAAGSCMFAAAIALLRTPVVLAGVRFETPAALGLLGLLPWMLGGRLRLAAAARAGAWLCLALALARPEWQRASQNVSLVALADVSGSMSQRALAALQSQLEQLERARPSGSTLHIVSFAARPQELAHAAQLSRPPAAQSGETDLAAALQRAYALFDADRAPAVLVLSDGRETRGDLLAEAERAAQRGVRIDHLPLGGAPEPPDVAVD
ncbi:MAG TPA: vWA domain-containing protein, partial [Polyangiales bacterium]|nr:vWA domain-containing protein [Polyangiales bacterium]